MSDDLTIYTRGEMNPAQFRFFLQKEGVLTPNPRPLGTNNVAKAVARAKDNASDEAIDKMNRSFTLFMVEKLLPRDGVDRYRVLLSEELESENADVAVNAFMNHHWQKKIAYTHVLIKNKRGRRWIMGAGHGHLTDMNHKAMLVNNKKEN